MEVQVSFRAPHLNAMQEPKFETYLVEYQMDGSSWSMEVTASSFEDAKRRIDQASNYGKVIGTLVARIPAVPGLGFLPRLACWWKNRVQ